MTTTFHHIIDLNSFNYFSIGWTIDYSDSPIDSAAHIHFVREPGGMNNRHESLLLLGVF